jgi:hypothetical protein
LRSICSRSKKPVRTFRSLSIGTCGTCINLPFCRARLRIRFSVVSSPKRNGDPLVLHEYVTPDLLFFETADPIWKRSDGKS